MSGVASSGPSGRLLATTRDRKTVVKRKKAEILRTNMAQLCPELIKMFPVQGKDKSFSLRTSSILMYGTCVTLRLISGGPEEGCPAPLESQTNCDWWRN